MPFLDVRWHFSLVRMGLERYELARDQIFGRVVPSENGNAPYIRWASAGITWRKIARFFARQALFLALWSRVGRRQRTGVLATPLIKGTVAGCTVMRMTVLTRSVRVPHSFTSWGSRLECHQIELAKCIWQ